MRVKQPTTKQKYRAVPTIIDGQRFASKKEGSRYQKLLILERAKIISDLKTQVRFDLHVNDVKICTYIADFTYYNSSGYYIVEDVKGFAGTPVYKLKKKLMWAVYQIVISEE